jgi:multiple sugar transport system ATP-binding protein
MDEPLSGLDAKLRVEMRTELKRLHASLGATFVYVTHDQAEAMTMADRIVVMADGVIQQVGTPLAVYGDPLNRFVAGFFGVPAMNFIEGQLVRDGASLVFRSPALSLPVPRSAGRDVPVFASDVAVSSAVLGVRPEHVRLAGPADGWPATVSLIETMGDETVVFLDYGGPTSLVARVDAEEKITAGDQRAVAFRADKLVFFDGGTGERILRFDSSPTVDEGRR